MLLDLLHIIDKFCHPLPEVSKQETWYREVCMSQCLLFVSAVCGEGGCVSIFKSTNTSILKKLHLLCLFGCDAY